MDKKVEESILQFRLEAIRDAQKMSRLAFLVGTIVSLSIILATWNAYFSWYTGFPLREKPPANEVTKVVHDEVVKQWVDSATISIPFIGIKVGVSDCSVFGSLGLLIINTWFLLSVRREYHVIRYLLKSTRKPDKWNAKAREWIYQGVAAYMLFINVSRINKLNQDKEKTHGKYRPKKTMQRAFIGLVFLPPLAIFFLIIADIMTVYILPAFYRYPHTPLSYHLGTGDTVKLAIMEGMASVLLAIIIILCTKIIYYVEQTLLYLTKYAGDFKKELND